ncbi:RNA polymerase sigma factor [Adhaeribacter rhizoryzae]|uniref:RNA polymerase sigma-70 factor n=1 Tax=Adhaeribacter rhizoryzae TaxID=2607907 RepID=A0A5M6D4A9_9BACT|nr:RNA polymerase sigma-70 factor [Adhaeribacter rhizoryzae]KAA5540579.1 RNA polymerase sigma-70 factor [Adhaeribacter rhizoryzae]
MTEANADNSPAIIQALKHGDRLAFEKIYQRFGPKLYAFTLKLGCNKEDAEEVVQEVFLKIWERKHLLDPQQNFDGYLFRMVRHLVYNKARHRVHEFAYHSYLASAQNKTESYIEESLDYQELDQLLQETYTALPPVRQQVFVMSRLEGLSNNEIAEKLQTSNSNIENHLNKALRAIRLKLKLYKVIYLNIGVLFSFL